MSIPYPISSESQLAQNYVQQIQPFWQQNMQLGQFNGVNDIIIHYAFVLHPNPKGSIAVSSGRMEALVKYKELVFDLYQNGYSVFIHDHRGQGQSGRMTANPQQGYVCSFDDYVSDFKTFYDQVIRPNSQHIPQLICHSMGSTIGALYMLKHPDDFARAALSGPMFGVRPALPNWAAQILIKANQWVNHCFSQLPWYFVGQGDYEVEEFDKNMLTHSKIRYQLFRDEYERHPEVKLGGITTIWLKAAVEAMDQVEQQASHLLVPVLVLQAGSDRIVDNRRQNRVAGLLPNCTKLVIKGASHELFIEADKYRVPSINAIFEFLSD